MSHAGTELREVLAGRPGSVNAFMARWGKLLVDYATALIPDRDEPFDRMVADMLVDALAQARVLPRDADDEQVRAYVIESAMRTVRARHRAVLDAPAAPTKATNSYTVDEVVRRTGLSAEDITAGISEGRMRAVRADNIMRVKGADIPGLGERHNVKAWHASAAERELLFLHHRAALSAEQIARMVGSSSLQVDALLLQAAGRFPAGSRGAAPAADGEMNRYLEGQLSADESSRFEGRVMKDQVAQRRLEELRGRHDAIRRLFDSPACDLSRIALQVRERNPHQPISAPPAAVLWLQAAGVAALLMLLYRVGTFMPPPDVRVESIEGSVSMDNGREGAALAGVRVLPGQGVATGDGAQVLLSVDQSSRVRLAENSQLALGEPVAGRRQVLQLDSGELWGRFTSSGHSFLVRTGGEHVHEIRGNAAEFGVAVYEHAARVLPDNLLAEQAAAFTASFERAPNGLKATASVQKLAGIEVGTPGGNEGINAGDVLVALDGLELDDSSVLRGALMLLPVGETAQLQVLREDTSLKLPLRRASPAPVMVLRVYRGSVSIGAPGDAAVLVNRGQWALASDGQPLLVGQRGVEDYRQLRMDAAERFKDRLHWLNTESFPLRAENNLLAIDRGLSALAASLERQRANEVRRDGGTEIDRFEGIMNSVFDSARQRVDAGQAVPRRTTADALGDEALLVARNEILAAIAHWRRQATSGAWPTLGAAAKTLHGRIQRDLDEMNELQESMTRAQDMQLRIAEFEKSMTLKQEDLNRLRGLELHDADGSRRKALDEQLASLREVARAGTDAANRVEVLMLRLNRVDADLDDLRRGLPAARAAVASAELALADIDRALAANIYTPAALDAATREAERATNALAAAKAVADRAQASLEDANASLSATREAESSALRALELPQSELEAKQETHSGANAARVAAQSKVDEARAEEARIKPELDALEQDDPGREAVQARLDAARKAVTQAEAALETARKAADEAKADLDKAQRSVDAAVKTASDAKAAREKQESAQAAATKANADAAAAQTRAQKASDDAARAVKDQIEAKAARQVLDADRLEVVERLRAGRSALESLERKIEAAEEQARPLRESLTSESQTVTAGEAARREMEQKRRERDQHQAVSDEIALTSRDLEALTQQRDQLAGSTLISGYDAMVQEYRALSLRADALRFLQERALLEDQNFALAQRAAQDRYRETAASVTTEAEALLASHCHAYTGFVLSDDNEEARQIRAKLLNAMWRLYYEPGIEQSPDANMPVCYYVATRSGAGADALRMIDDRWKLALAQVLDKTRFEAASRLGPADMVAEGN